MQLSFQDRTYLVTGGGSGIGKGVAAGLVAAGAAVMIVGRNPDKLAAAVKDIEALKTGAIGYEPADITDEEQTLRVVDAATAWHGRLHGVVHCAGGSQTIGPWFGAYGVTKSAVDHMMKLAADELGPSWVRVNSIRPGLIRTDLVVPVTESPELSADYRVCTPLPRVGEVEDVANLAMFLLSDAASWITGQVINVDGGHMLRRGPDFSPMLEPVFGADGLRGVVG